MRRLEVRVSGEETNKVEEILTSSGAVYSLSAGQTEVGECSIFSITTPDESLDDLMSNISKKLDMRRKENVITVYNVTATISPHLEKMQEKAREQKAQSNPLESIIQPWDKYLKPGRDIVVMVVLATLVALAGLFLNNVAIIIGAMLLSPLLGPINAVTVNASMGRLKHVFRAETSVFSLLLVSILAATIVTFAAGSVMHLGLTEQIMIRTQVNASDVVIAFLLGVAGGLALVTELPEVLVGVAVAVALVPPMTVTGISIALGRADMFAGALFLTLANLFGLKAGGILILLSKGVSPRRYYEKKKARVYGTYSLIIFSAILVIMMLLLLFSKT